MRNWLALAMGAALVGLVALPVSALAQQKTVKACEDEWRANKADNQAKGITEKAYVAQCRGGSSAAQPAPAPSASPPPAAPTAAASGAGKTVSACRAEWRANKDAYQAAGVTEKAYVDKCRAGEAVALPSAPPPSTPAASALPASPPPAAATPSSGKTAKACQEEWRANKAGYQAAGVTEKAYVEKCRAGEAVALPTTPSTPPPTAAPSAPPPSTPAAAPSQPATKPAARQSPPVATSAPTGAGQFASEAEAKSHCPADVVVWVNLNSKIYHFAGYKNYGTTEHGAYMCEKQATTDGFRASKNEKRPGA
jgi:hypothetical protein